MKVAFRPRNLALLVALSLSAYTPSSYSKVLIEKFEDRTIYHLSADSISFEMKSIEGIEFQAASLTGLEGMTGIHYEVGSPAVPVIRFNVIAESEKNIKILSEKLISTMAYKIQGDLLPVLAPVEKVPSSNYKIEKNASFFSKAPYPQALSTIRYLGSIRGEKQFQITLYPAQFIGANNEFKISRQYQVTVQHKSIESVKQDGQEGILFVVGTKFKNSASLNSYMAKKAALGMDVIQFEAGSMNPDQIRSKIKTIYKAKPHLKYVLVIGDASDVPAKPSSIINGITDHYYASIDTDNYATDIQTPDLFVGRLSAANEQQLNTILLKYTRYMDGDFASRGWTGKASFLATNDRWELAEGTHNYAIDTYTKQRGYSGSFPEAQQQGGDKLYAITYHADTRQVMDSFIQGRSIIDYSGHGANTFWDAPRVSQSDVRSLNYTALPFVISNACITGDFRVDESFAETWQRQEWGAIMFWGSMDSTFWDEDDILEKKMFDGIFKEHKTAFGTITRFALAEMDRFYGGQGKSKYYWETYLMFGDPSISLRLR